MCLNFILFETQLISKGESQRASSIVWFTSRITVTAIAGPG